MSVYELMGITITIGIFIVALVSGGIAMFSVLGNATQRRLTRLEAGQAKLEAVLTDIKKLWHLF